jgi:glycosyltransferase involved in cell wall biosynthesis
MNVVFLFPYPLAKVPSQRFRFEQYFQLLEQRRFSIHKQAFLDDKLWGILYTQGHYWQKILGFIRGYSRRIAVLGKVRCADFVFIHRECAPAGPPVFEWFIAKILRKKIIYDFDDAIWVTDRKDESLVMRVTKWRSKVQTICRWSYKVSAGNNYLADFAREVNSHVFVIPTTIDTTQYIPRKQSESRRASVIIGWTGSRSTLKYLKDVEDVLKKLEDEFPDVSYLIVADQKPSLSLDRWRFEPWQEKNEIDVLRYMDIGLMPLPDEAWANGKCGLKALQYMALAIPPVISPVGVNKQIVTQGVEGFLAGNAHDWYIHLKELITNATLRQEMGQRSHKRLLEHYSVESNSASFVSLFG